MQDLPRILFHDFQAAVGCVKEHRQFTFSYPLGTLRILSDT